MILNKERVNEIKLKANELSEDSLWDIAKANDIGVYFSGLSEFNEEWKEVSGLIFRNDKGKYSIFINEKDSENRKRFTLAHELGHFFLHKEYLESNGYIMDSQSAVLFRITDNPNEEKEQEANLFAAELLMPERLVTKAWLTTKDTDELAKIFKVSVLAMSYRLTNLWLLD